MPAILKKPAVLVVVFLWLGYSDAMQFWQPCALPHPSATEFLWHQWYSVPQGSIEGIQQNCRHWLSLRTLLFV